MIDPIVLLDVWEGSLEIDEDVIQDGGIQGIIVRINDMNGGHHLDSNFWNQYTQALNAGLATSIYFVYNPWVDGIANFNWLDANIPSDAKSVFVDIEVAYSGITSTRYASDVQKCINLCKAKWNTAIYTGQWFLDKLAYWPTNVPYWWAQYPNIMYPSGTVYWTFTQLYSALATLTYPYNKSSIPGELLIWQCSGDRIILPGTSRTVDINVFYGAIDQLYAWMNGGTIIPPISQDDVLINEELWYDGCLYQQWDINTAHGIVHTTLLTFDKDKVEEFFVTPAPTARHYVPDWLAMFPDMHIAINCDQFVGIDMGGYNVSRGQPYGPQGTEATVYIDQQNNFTLNVKSSPLWNGYAIPNLLAQGGVTLEHIYDINALKGHRPRTATGKSQDGNTIYFCIVDGDETYDITTESGLDFVETSEFMLRHGAYEVYMSDGGGSTTLSKRRDDGIVYVVNAARGEDYIARYDASLRRVANALCVKMKTGPIPPTPDTLTGILKVEGYKEVTVLIDSN